MAATAIDNGEGLRDIKSEHEGDEIVIQAPVTPTEERNRYRNTTFEAPFKLLENNAEDDIARVSSSRPDPTDVSTEYKKALEEMASIINSSDNAFRRKYAGVIWKHLTVRTQPLEGNLIEGERRGTWRDYKPDLWRIISRSFPETHSSIFASQKDSGTNFTA